MIRFLKTKLIALIDSIKGEVKDVGGFHIFLIALILFLIALPFLIAYYLLLEPSYKVIRMLIEAPKLGFKDSYRKQFRTEEYEREEAWIQDKAWEATWE